MIDTHCHLYDRAFPDLSAALEEAAEAGVEAMVLIGVDLETSREVVRLAEQHLQLSAVVGAHPNYAADFRPETLAEFRELLHHPKVVAVGEIGLDYHWDYATPVQQFEVLSVFLDLALETSRPVVFHCREAYGDLLSYLEKRSTPGRLLFHCFAGDQDDLLRAKEMDAYYGVDGPITYAKADELREVVGLMPRDRVLLETDAPYLPPVPFRGKTNSPAYLPYICQKLADIWGCSPEEVARQTTANAQEFFGFGSERGTT